MRGGWVVGNKEGKRMPRMLEIRSVDIKFMNEFWGERCPDYDPGCPVCQAWRLFETFGEPPDEDDVYSQIMMAVADGAVSLDEYDEDTGQWRSQGGE